MRGMTDPLQDDLGAARRAASPMRIACPSVPPPPPPPPPASDAAVQILSPTIAVNSPSVSEGDRGTMILTPA